MRGAKTDWYRSDRAYQALVEQYSQTTLREHFNRSRKDGVRRLIGRLRTGEHVYMTYEALDRIASDLGTRVEDIFGEPDLPDQIHPSVAIKCRSCGHRYASADGLCRICRGSGPA